VSDASVPELLRALASTFAARGLRWYVFGAQAVVAHGRPRLTADVDVAVDSGGLSARALAALLEPAGFTLRFPLPDDRAETARLLPLVHVASSIPVDLVITGPGLDDELLERARLVDLGGAIVPVISAEDLVAMKVLAGRRKDLEDVRGVLAEKLDELDVERVRSVLAAFIEVSGDVRLNARFDRLLRAARRRRVGRPSP
jgi:hypothetical protein